MIVHSKLNETYIEKGLLNTSSSH